jgi:hypothetical protein
LVNQALEALSEWFQKNSSTAADVFIVHPSGAKKRINDVKDIEAMLASVGKR